MVRRLRLAPGEAMPWHRDPFHRTARYTCAASRAMCTNPPPTKSNAKKRANPIYVARLMPGCICGKKVGFTGAHKKKCPLSRSATTAAVGESSVSELKTRIAQLERQIATRRSGALEFKIGEKGGVAVYGLGRFAVTLYYEQWIRLLIASEELRTFLEDNRVAGKLKLK
jgi:hypothetical protein